MKHLYILALISSISYGQIPAGYYNTATGSGYTLKTQLSNIIDNHNDQGYNAIDGFMSSYDLDNYYETGSNTILDIYSENPTSNDPYTFTPGNDECGNYSQEGDCYNKEHVIPQSVFSSNTPMQSDAHQLLPTDGRAKSTIAPGTKCFLFLNNSNKILAKTHLSKGGMTSTIVDVRIVMKQALEHSATAIVLVHNHPSGVPNQVNPILY